MAVNNSAGIFDWGPTGRSIEVNASGQLLTTNEPVGGLYPLGYGKTGRALCVDGSGRLCVTSAGGGTDTTAIEADLTEVRSDFYNASGDLYSNRARGWETVLSSPFTTERRPYSAGVFHGEMLLAGTDEDTLWKVNFENKSVDVLDSGFTTSIFQGKDSDGQNVTQEMFISDVYIWDGDSKHAHGLSTPKRAQKILGNIYLFQDDSNVWRWDKTSITSFTDVSSDIVWNDMAGSWRISVDCRGFGFIYTRDYSGGTKYINKWNGNPDEAALVVLEKNSTEADEFGLFRYNNDVFAMIVGGTEAGKLYKYDWGSHTFTQFIADTGYESSVNLGSNVAGALYNGDFHFLAQKKSNSEWHLVKFDGWNITLVDDDLPTIQVQHEMMVYNHHLYLLTYDHSVQNSTKLYRWIKSPLQDSRETSERVGRIDTRVQRLETPPSGWALPSASDWEYGDSYFHLGSGLYRRFVNPVGVPQWYQEVQHGRLAEVSEDNGLTGYTSLVLGAAGDWVPYVSNQASGSFKDCPGVDVTASGFTVNAGAAKCPISRGFWIVQSNVTFGGSNNTTFATSIFVNGNQQKNTTTHGKTLAGDHRISLHNQGVIHLADGDELTLRFMSNSVSPTANIYSWNLFAHKYNPSS